MPEELVQAVKVALSRACRNEHTINKHDEYDTTTFWIACGDEQLSSIVIPHSSQDASAEIRHWQHRVMDDHRWSLAPECAVAAVLRALPESEAVKEAANAVRYGEPVDTYTWDRVVEKILAALTKLADDEEKQ